MTNMTELTDNIHTENRRDRNNMKHIRSEVSMVNRNYKSWREENNEKKIEKFFTDDEEKHKPKV